MNAGKGEEKAGDEGRRIGCEIKAAATRPQLQEKEAGMGCAGGKEQENKR